MEWDDARVIWLLRSALDEDLGDGDATTLATVDASVPARARIVAREQGVVAGLSLVAPLSAAFRERGRPEEEARSIEVVSTTADGAFVAAGAAVCELRGTARALLMLERTLLNFVGRLSGIATLTRRYVEAVRAVGAKARVLDTRKTTPAWRVLEKYAVRCGGGHNHRFGLFDAILIKDNHVIAAGGIRAAVQRATRYASGRLAVEVECDTLDQVREALGAGATAVLLDNFSPADVAEAVRFVAGRARIEVSGRIELKTVADYARAGADDISVGRLTHSARALDLSLELQLESRQ